MKEERPPLVQIHYLRPPDREKVYTQYLIHDGEGVKVTYAHDLNFESPIRIAGVVVLETGSEVIWFTFPGAWHDIGVFHRADGSYSGTMRVCCHVSVEFLPASLTRFPCEHVT